MQQEATKKNKKWLWIVLILVALLAVVGVVLGIFMFDSQGSGDTDKIESDLYWNIDGEYYQSISEIEGLSGREAAEDGNYYINFAVGGKQVEYQVVDKQLVNYIDAMQVMGLVFDADGVVIDAVDADEFATNIADDFYVQSVEGNTVTLNSSMALNGMEKEIEITENTGVYDVDPDAEMVGQLGQCDIMDKVIVYSNAEDGEEVTHLFIVEHPVEADVYWRVERCYDTETKLSTRVPDKNGVYTIQFAYNGEVVDLKCKDATLVNAIDSYAPLVGQFALLFDEEGYIVDFADVAMALRGKYLAQDYHITAIDGDTYTATRISSGSEQGKVVSFKLAEDCQIWQCCQYACYEHNCGEYIDYLQLQDRVNIYTNTDGEAIMIFVTRRVVEGGMYYNYARNYGGTEKGTNRTKVNGYYVFEMMHDGELITLKTKDKAIADQVDAISNKCMGLKLDGDIILRVYDGTCVYGGGNLGASTPITDMMGSIVTLTSSYSGDSWNRMLSADCQIYNAITGEYGKKIGGTMDVQKGDLVTTYRNIYDEICIIFVNARPVSGAKLYYNISRSWDSEKLETKREPDADGYYNILLACEGEQVTVKTKDRGLASFIDEQLAPLVGLKVNSDGVITNAYIADAVVPNSGKACNYRYVENVTKKSFNTYYYPGGIKSEANKVKDTTTWNIAKDCKVYNCSTAYASHRGEVSTLKNGDYIQAIRNYVTNEITHIFIMQRDPTYGVKSYDANCAHCGKTVTWNPYAGGSIYADGHYFMCADLTLSQGTIGKSDDNACYDVVVDLKGYTLTGTGRTFLVYDKLTIMDSVGTGKIQGTTPSNGVATSGSCIMIGGGGELNLYGGELGVTEKSTEFGAYGGVVYVGSNATFNMYGGKITGGTATERGGNVFLGGGSTNPELPGATFNMYGGTIDGGSCPAGGNVFTGWNATFNMSGGTIDGGDVYVYSSEYMTLSGKPVISGTGVTVPSGVKLLVSGLTDGASIVVNGDGVFTEELTNAESYLQYFKSASDADSIELKGNALNYVKAPIDYNGVDNSNLVFEAGTTNAYCPVCDKTVTWTALTAAEKTTLANGHYYLDKDFTYQGTAGDMDDCFIVAPGTGSAACLHLNGHNITAVDARAIYGSSGVLNILGNGTVTGGYANSSSYILAGTVGINTASGSGTINMIGGTYVCTTAQPTAAISSNGGKINMYAGATIKGNGNQAVYVGKAEAVNAVFSLYGGTIEGGAVYMTGANTEKGNTATLNLAGGKVTGGITANANSVVNVSGAPEVSGAAVALNGTKLTLGEMTSGASIKMNAVNGVFTEETEKAEQYKAYFNADGADIVVYENALCVFKQTNDELQPDVGGYAVCPVCGGDPVKWTAVTGDLGSNCTDGGHYYLPDDVTTTGQFITMTGGKTVCLHLNGKDLTYGSRMFVTGSTLNIMGTGTVTSTTTTIENHAGLVAAYGGSTINLYGGEYKTTNPNGAPVAKTFSSATAVINVLGDGVTIESVVLDKGALNMSAGTITDGINASVGTVTLSGTAKLEAAEDALLGKINIATGAKLVVNGDWTGSAKVDFESALANNAVPAANGASTGEYTGSLVMADGTVLYGKDSLLVTGDYTSGGGSQPSDPDDDETLNPYDGVLELDDSNQALCPVCNETVTWTAINGLSNKRISNSTGHFYYSEDCRTGENVQNFVNAPADGKVCIHLNGKSVSFGSRITGLNAGATINIMGSGTMTLKPFNGDAVATGNLGGLYLVGDNTTINLYAGTYVSEDSTRPMGLIKNATAAINVMDGVTLTGGISVEKGTASVSGAANVDLIVVAEDGKLSVAEDWTGTAAVTFAATITDGVIPAANGVSTGSFTGTLTTVVEEVPYNVIAKDGGLVLSTGSGEEEGKLQLDDNNYGYCEACGETVQWTAITDRIQHINDVTDYEAGRINSYHYYLTDDITSTMNSQFIERYYNKNCLHLNGYDITCKGRMRIGIGATLNIMGSGSFTCSSDLSNTNYNDCAMKIESGAVVNLYGGTYSCTNPNIPVVLMQWTKDATRLNIHDGAEIVGDINIQHGTVQLNGTAKTDNIIVSTDGNLVIAGDWTGEAQATFPTITDNVIANGICLGNYTGTLTTVYEGNTYNVIPESGKLVLDISQEDDNTDTNPYDGVLELDGSNQALCPVCNETVTWTDINSMSLKRISSNTGHFYYSADCLTGENVQNFVNVPADGKVCIHLNGKSVSFGSRITGLNAGATINIMGSGTMTLKPFNGDAVATGNLGGLYLVGDNTTINLYAGTYVSEDSTRPMGLIKNATAAINVMDGVTLTGGISVEKGTASVSGAANVDFIAVAENGKLSVAEDWTGTAVASFAALTEDKEIPEANGVSGGAFTGTLTLDTPDGDAISGCEGRLVVALDPITAEILRAKAVSTAANAMTFPENATTHDAYCPACGKTVTWKAVTVGANTALFPDSLQTIEGKDHMFISGVTGEPTYMNFITLTGLTDASLVDHNTMCIHLNGFDVSYAGRMLINKPITLNIMGEGSMNSTGANRTETYGNIAVISGATVNLYGGTYTYNGEKSLAGTPYGALFSSSADAEINIYDGVSVSGTNAPSIGMTRGTFNMYGGTVENGTGYNNGTNLLGGNICAIGVQTSKVNLNLYGGTVRNGAAYNGGNIYANYANVTIGNTVTGGTASGNGAMGGNIFVQNCTTEVTEKATVTGGSVVYDADSSKTYGGNITVSGGGTMVVNGTVTGGSAGRGGNIDMTAGSTVTINDGAVISGGSAVNGHGGNIYFQNAGAVLNLNGGTISGGSVIAGKLGGNVYGNNGKLYLSGNVTVTDGTVGEGTGNIYITSSGKLNVLNDWTGEASVKFAAAYAENAEIAAANGQCGSLDNDVFTAGGSYTGNLNLEDTDTAITGENGVLTVAAAESTDE